MYLLQRARRLKEIYPHTHLGRRERVGASGLWSPPEPRLTLSVGGHPTTFLVDTGAQHSVLTKANGPLSSRTSWVQGATGRKIHKWTNYRTVDLGQGTVTHSFLVVPECPYPLLGRDLLTKLGVQIHFSKAGAQVLNRDGQPIQVLTVSLQDEHRLFETPVTTNLLEAWLQDFPQAWAETGGLGRAKCQAPIIIDLKPTAMPVSIRQYPMSKEAHMGIQPHITRFLELGVLRPCRSPWNTPLLPVKKPGTRDYRPVQDLREVNKRTMDIHPTVPNPYNLLSTLSPDRTWYTVLDLKDAFFCLPLAPQSQELFAFEWRDPERGISGQLTWTRLPQGFKNSPTLFDEALHRDLTDFRTQHPEVTLLQYVDDLLLAAPTKEACIRGTKHLLRELGDKGYRASAKKAQICQTKVTYLGYILSEGKRWLTPGRIETVARIPPPQNPREALLLDTDRVQFGPPVTLNPATLLPAPEDQQSAHDCRQVLAETHGTREDLKDQELPDADHSWYTDGSSYIDSGTRRAGAAVVDGHHIIWAQSLPPGTSAQKAELIALTKALELSEGKKANIYTDSRYAFATAHTHGSIYERRGLLTSEGKEQLLRLLFEMEKSIIGVFEAQESESKSRQTVISAIVIIVIITTIIIFVAVVD
ncbi:LOW QUALITY PROTEIN: uncharacterized protein LOC123383933 [Felis catus]|uniref:LOW QUALITY PROTEIN: uncharacterized protein LOC123383933 n=1 Tax=Felis catus TaxID=9685 RepID=UPI001D19AE52|nr:LOW QUALITY PROTEIN: uncharacterized protein LOC123383933 [Felis catus]